MSLLYCQAVTLRSRDSRARIVLHCQQTDRVFFVRWTISRRDVFRGALARKVAELSERGHEHAPWAL